MCGLPLIRCSFATTWPFLSIFLQKDPHAARMCVVETRAECRVSKSFRVVLDADAWTPSPWRTFWQVHDVFSSPCYRSCLWPSMHKRYSSSCGSFLGESWRIPWFCCLTKRQGFVSFAAILDNCVLLVHDRVARSYLLRVTTFLRSLRRTGASQGAGG